MTEDEKRITNVEKRVDNLETKYLKVKFDVHFKRTLAKFDSLGMKLDNLDNQIQRCTKLMIWLFGRIERE